MNGHEHRWVGAVAGPLTGFGLAINQNRPISASEVCGWLLGGIGGSQLPDILEPAYCPNHRKFAHSGTVLAVDLAFLGSETLEGWIKGLKGKAAAYRWQAQLNPQSHIWFSLLAALCELAAGMLPAVLAGYASHLLCDATTPFGIPIC